MKQVCIDIMERTLNHYTDEQIDAYIHQMEQEGPGDQAFARLTSDIGLLIAMGRCQRLQPRFVRMMDLCCQVLPNHQHLANDFSIRELCLCLMALEKADCMPQDQLDGWKDALRQLDPLKTYDNIAPSADATDVYNWALFNAVGEWLRHVYLGADNLPYIEKQLGSQMQRYDENGFYDEEGSINYDLVPRLLYSLLLHFGYHGKYAQRIDENLRKAGLLSLNMQSVTGEMAFGGRSMLFLYNEAIMAGVFEFEATRYAKKGNLEQAGQFKAAAQMATDALLCNFTRSAGHIKNRYPVNSKVGCEGYGHFLKYMITVASFIYCAELLADDAIVPTIAPAARGGFVSQPSDLFHKIFANCGGYMIEFETDANFLYDANGLGRIHKAGVPSALCLSVPFPTEPNYTLPTPNPFPASIAAFVEEDGKLVTGAEEGARYELLSSAESAECVSLKLLCTLVNGKTVPQTYTVSSKGIDIEWEGEGAGLLLPLFAFDGEVETDRYVYDHEILIAYEGHLCRYQFDGHAERLHDGFHNRNGRYQLYALHGAKLHIELI